MEPNIGTEGYTALGCSMDANTLTRIAAALDERERVAGALPSEGPVRVKPRYLSYGEAGDGEWFYDLCPEDCGYIASFETPELAEAVAQRMNAAPADNALHRALFELAKGWLANPTLDTAPFGPDWCTAAGKKYAAERILALLAHALLPQDAAQGAALGSEVKHG